MLRRKFFRHFKERGTFTPKTKICQEENGENLRAVKPAVNLMAIFQSLNIHKVELP